MLDQTLQQQLRQYLEVRYRQLDQKAKEAFTTVAATMAGRGLSQSGAAMVAYNQLAIESLRQAVSIAWEGLRRHVEAHGTAYSENLAQNLKDELDKQVPSRIWRIPEIHLLGGEKLRGELAIAVDDARLLAINEAKW